MKIVRLDENNKVVEILPESTYELGISYWYGEEFANQCVEAPDDIKQNLFYNKETGLFIEKETINDDKEFSEIELLKQQVEEQQMIINAMLGVVE